MTRDPTSSAAFAPNGLCAQKPNYFNGFRRVLIRKISTHSSTKRPELYPQTTIASTARQTVQPYRWLKGCSRYDNDDDTSKRLIWKRSGLRLWACPDGSYTSDIPPRRHARHHPSIRGDRRSARLKSGYSGELRPSDPRVARVRLLHVDRSQRGGSSHAVGECV